jgi:hypothetical protein
MLQKSVILLVLLMFPVEAPAQRLEIMPRLGMGSGAGSISAEAGVRLDLSKGTWGGYGRFGIQAFSQSCAESLPPQCNLPKSTARELAVGVSRILSFNATWSGYVSAGFGVLDWDGRDSFLDGEVTLRRPLGSRADLAFGLHSLVSTSLERPRNGEKAIVRDHNVAVVNPFVGLSVGMGG